VSVTSSELAPPAPLPQANVPPPPPGPKGGEWATVAWGVRGGGEPIQTAGEKAWYSVFSLTIVLVYCAAVPYVYGFFVAPAKYKTFGISNVAKGMNGISESYFEKHKLAASAVLEKKRKTSTIYNLQ
jgi:hypothetical protein